MESDSVVLAGTAIGAVIATLGIFAAVIAVAWYILQVVAYWKIFTKAGKPGWHSIIPILNTWDEVDLSWSRTMAWVMICVIIVSSIFSGIVSNAQTNQTEVSGFVSAMNSICAIAVVVLGAISQYKLAKAFGKGIGFFIGLLLLNPIFKLILGFGDSKYLGPQG